MKIKNNSKFIKKNDIFINTNDNKKRKNEYILDAINKGASIVITDSDYYKKNKYILNVNDINMVYYDLLNCYYNKPFDDLNLIGVTGTDGKTTVAMLINYLLNNYKKCAYLGTNGLWFKKIIKTKNTTPDLKDIFKYARLLSDDNYRYLVMETSSEGLLHNRCYNLKFERAIMTNISNEHLNIHKDINNYLDAKLKLFKNLKLNGIAILNSDDKYFGFFKNNINSRMITYGMDKSSDYYFYDVKEQIDNTCFKLKHNNKIYNIKSPLVGIFNCYNLVCAIACINSFGINISSIINNIGPNLIVPGRMNFIDYGQNYKILVDYAHTENATFNVLSFLNKYKKARIITIAGCAGGRYKEKRRKIGKIISDMSDIAIFTEDDPRDENVNGIICSMKKDCVKENIIVINNRKKAIRYALKIALKGDIIVILGKGVDNYMAKGKKYKKYSDVKVIKRYFTKVF